MNTEKFEVEKLEIQIPHRLETVWAKPKHEATQFKRITLCSFYSPPRSRLRNKLKDHIFGTLQMLTTKTVAFFVVEIKTKWTSPHC